MDREERRMGFKRKFEDPGNHNRNQQPYDRYALPEGWVGCPGFGDEISGIIPSIVPLGESFSDHIQGETYTPKQVIQQQRLLGRELGLVIDLTNTTRYYPLSDWGREGIRHVKIKCQGRDSVPDSESVNRFIDEVSKFFSHRRDPMKFILVHCTHGHNRTGFMIVHYLIHTQSITVTEAITQFATARHPGIYKQDYIDALYMAYHERKPDSIVCPQTPEWKRSTNQDNENNVKEGAMTIDDVLGETIPFDQQKMLQEACYHALDLATTLGSRVSSVIPGVCLLSLFTGCCYHYINLFLALFRVEGSCLFQGRILFLLTERINNY